MAAPAYLGKLDTNRPARTAGRQIDTWTYRNGLPGGAPIEVKVHLVAAKDGDIAFTASSEVFDTLEEKDINVLKARVEKGLRLFCEDHSGIEWEDWLEVKVEGQRTTGAYDESTSMGLSITYRPIPRGVAADGRIFTVHRGNKLVVPFPTPNKSAAELDAGALIFNDRNPGSEISYIKSTPEALAALADLQERINQLRNSLSALLTQERVDTELWRLAKLPLMLPSGTPA